MPYSILASGLSLMRAHVLSSVPAISYGHTQLVKADSIWSMTLHQQPNMPATDPYAFTLQCALTLWQT